MDANAPLSPDRTLSAARPAPASVAADLAHVRTWIFDLDNTLYPPSARLFDQIERRMTAFVMRALALAEAEADALRARYWADHGTTLAGLMAHHGTDPAGFLDDVHAIDLGALTPDPLLARHLAALPGRRIVFTNADIRYADRVLSARGIAHLFDALYGVEEAGFVPKPSAEAFARILAADGCDPATAAMFEDDARNLSVPAALGMRTVWLAPDDQPAPAHVHHRASDLTGFLSGLAGGTGP
jgi:putative hydrolase of the HAD superfamily